MILLPVIYVKHLVPGSLWFPAGRKNSPALVISNTRDVGDEYGDFYTVTLLQDSYITSVIQCRDNGPIYDVILPRVA